MKLIFKVEVWREPPLFAEKWLTRTRHFSTVKKLHTWWEEWAKYRREKSMLADFQAPTLKELQQQLGQKASGSYAKRHALSFGAFEPILVTTHQLD